MRDRLRELAELYDTKLLRRLVSYLRPYRSIVLISIALLTVVSALRLVGPYLTKVAIDESIARGDLEKLFPIAVAYLAALLLQFAFSFLQTYLTNWAGQKIMSDLRTQIFSHIQKLHMAYFDRQPVGRIITRMTTDVEVLNDLFTSGVVSVFGDLFSLLGIVAVMLWLNWKLALISFAVIPLLFVASLVFKVKVRQSYRRVRTAIANINSFLQENITGMSVVQVFAQEHRKFGEFRERNEAHTRAHIDSILYYAVFYPAVNLIGALAVALILWYGGLEVLDQALTLGAVVAFIQYSERFYKPISDLSEKFNILQSAMASSERIFSLLDVQPQILPPAQPVVQENIRGEIRFENVTFSYEPGQPVLRNVSFQVQPGERVAIVGATGSGKSTIISLLARFYDIEEGRIQIDGTDIPQMSLSQLRSSLAIVLQDPFLFSGTVQENIRLWGKPVSREQAEEAARQVNADAFVRRLPGQYNARVTERGGSLSTGQRQLLSFARALAHDPRILILDEATSSVDTDTESLIQEALAQLMKGRTSLVVAHRLSTIQYCDRIIVLHKGEIHEQGTHRELLQRKDIYYKLYQLQFKDQLLEAG